MWRIILVTFVALGWAWFELSGGSEFEPGQNGLEVLAKVEESELPAEQDVSRNIATDVELVSLAVESTNTVTMEPVAQPVVATSGNATAPVQPAVDPVKTEAVVQEMAAVDYRKVTGSRVNLRAGPGTSYGIVTKLVQGDEVEILDDAGDGWVQLRSLSGDNVGWMSADFLIASN